MSQRLPDFLPELGVSVCVCMRVCVCVCRRERRRLRGGREGEEKREREGEITVLFSVLSEFGFLDDIPSYTIDAEFFKPNSAESSDMHLS